MDTILEVKNLCFSYQASSDESVPKIWALNDVSFSVAPGEYVALIGHNGSGKSTLARIIMGLLGSQGGTISIMNEIMTDANCRSLRKHLGIIFQNPDNQFIGATVEDDIAFGLENLQVKHAEMKKIIYDFASKVGMLDYMDKESSNLSGGQKQRVAIAGVLAMNPKILIMDEASSMLDPQGRLEIRNLIKTMREENPELTIISITHDIEEAYLADRVIVLNEGKVFLVGTPEEVFKNDIELRKIKLDIPFIHRIKEAFKDASIDLSGATDIKEVEDLLCR